MGRIVLWICFWIQAVGLIVCIAYEILNNTAIPGSGTLGFFLAVTAHTLWKNEKGK